jgi:intraflagellar transport protein 74
MMDAKITQLQNRLGSKEFQVHQRGLELQRKKKALLAKRVELEEDTDASLTPDEMREKLRIKVKDANTEIESSEKKIKQLDQLVERYHDDIRTKEQELAEAKKHAAKAKKYEAVYERDRKMQEFIDEFPMVMKEELANKEKLKSTIALLMRHISKQISSSTNLPSSQQLADMKDELSFREQKLKNSKNTLTLLNSDLAMRREELEKINNLDKKINAELKSLKDKIQSMQVEMSQFKTEDELKREAADAKKRLTKDKARTKKLRESSKQQVQIMGQAFDKRKKELAGNETMKRMDALEQRLRNHSSTVFSLQDFINSRKRESDYIGIRTEVNEITANINKFIIEQINVK